GGNEGERVGAARRGGLALLFPARHISSQTDAHSYRVVVGRSSARICSSVLSPVAILPPGLSRKILRIRKLPCQAFRLSDVNLEISGFEAKAVDVDGNDVFEITTFLFHPIFKCFSRQE